jgi:ABC-2 type transport system permease protein
MTRFLSLEVVRALRDPRYLILALAMPVGLYLLFTQLFGTHGERVEGISRPVELMIAMAAYGGIWSVLSATAPRIAAERQSGWLAAGPVGGDEASRGGGSSQPGGM